MKRRKIAVRLFLLGISLLPGRIAAQDATKHDAIKMVEPDGHEIVYNLSTHPKVTFEDKSIRLATDRLEVSYELYDVHKIEFIDTDNSGVEELLNKATVYNISPESIEISGLDEAVTVSVFDTAGKLMLCGETDADGHTLFSITGLPAGVYVVNADKTSFKFIKK